MSNVKGSKFVLNFLEISRIDIAITHLNGLLYQSESISVAVPYFHKYVALALSERKQFSDILFHCYLLRLLPSGIENEVFLKKKLAYLYNREFPEISSNS